MRRVPVVEYALSLCALTVLACGAPGSGKATADSAVTSIPPAADAGGDRCQLLTDAEIEQAIGPHGPGHAGIPNEWGEQSCRWTATRSQAIDGYPNGWHDAIEAAAFNAFKSASARQMATGEPVAGFPGKAQFDKSYGQLWFECANGRMCAIGVNTNAGEHREEIATRLAHLLESRAR